MKNITIIIRIPEDAQDKNPLKHQSQLVQNFVRYIYEKVPGLYIVSFEGAKTYGIEGLALAERFFPVDDFHMATRDLSQRTKVIILSENKAYMASDFGGCINNTRAQGVIYREKKEGLNFLGIDGGGVPISAEDFLKNYAK